MGECLHHLPVNCVYLITVLVGICHLHWIILFVFVLKNWGSADIDGETAQTRILVYNVADFLSYFILKMEKFSKSLLKNFHNFSALSAECFMKVSRNNIGLFSLIKEHLESTRKRYAFLQFYPRYAAQPPVKKSGEIVVPYLINSCAILNF